MPPDTVALAFALLHVPPETISDSVIDEPTQTLAGPVITLTPPDEFIVIVFAACAEQLRLETVYIIVSMPAESPVTVPPATDAEVLLLLQTPPVVPSVKLIEEPVQTNAGPDMLPTTGELFIVIVLVAVPAPHAPETI
jgi:hypothetical protein